MADIQPPPTYELPIEINTVTKQATFSSNWLKWFIDLTGILNSAGGTSLEHNSLSGLQGGRTSQYYHLTQTQHGALVDTKNANTVYAGPTTGAAAVPTFRALVTADLPAGVGTVTSVAVSGSDGIGVSGSPITTSGTVTLTLGDITPDSVSTGTVTSSTLTSGRIPLVSTSGLIVDSDTYTYTDGSTFSEFLASRSASGEISYTVRNLHATGASVLYLATDGNGDTYTRYAADLTGAAPSWASGIDSSLDKFVIANAINLSTASTHLFAVTRTGSVITNASGSALSTSTTDGFTYIPTCAGTPTGAPTAVTGAAPMVIDTTNHKLYFYSGGAWRDAGP